MVGILGKKRPVYDDPPVPPMVPPPLNWSQGALTPRPLETSHWSESAAAAAWSLVAFSRWLLSPRSFLSSEALLLHSDLASRSEPVSQNSGLAEQHRSDQCRWQRWPLALEPAPPTTWRATQLSVRGTEGESQ